MSSTIDNCTAEGLMRYLRASGTARNHSREIVEVYEKFLKDIEALFALRMRAEEYWNGSPRGSPYNYKEHRYVAKQADGALPLEWNDIHDELCPDTERAPRTLIVQIALNCSEEVRLISAGMRRVLSRERVLTPIGNAQQLDTYCMRWLMRQPGRTEIEKAGTRQRIMAVVRREQFNTLENRVFKDFIIRCRNLAEAYIENLDDKFKCVTCPEYIAVKAFTTTCTRAMLLPEFDTISSLSDLPSPNYVLQQDAKYSKIWRMYLKLMAQVRLAERLWQKRDAIAKKISTLTDFSRQRTSRDDFLYKSKIWFNPIGKCEDPFDIGVTHFALADKNLLERRKQQDVSHMISDDVGVIDITGEDVYGDWIVAGGLHENANPRIEDDTYPLWDDVEQLVDSKRRDNPSVTELLKRKVADVCAVESICTTNSSDDKNNVLSFGSYASCLVGEYRTVDCELRELVILSPDDWDVYTQEAAIQAFSSIGRSNVRLLWRSIAAVLGCETLISPLVREDSFVVVMDFRNDGSILLSSLKYLREEDKPRLIPQRAAFRNGSGKNGRHEWIGKVDVRKAFQSWLIVDADVVCVTGCVPDTFGEQLSQYGIRCEVQRETLFDSDRVYRVLCGKSRFAMVIESADDDWLLHGARRFCRDRLKCVLYYDELEPMWVVGQDKDKECITQYPLVQGDERSVGGQEYVLKIPDNIMGIGGGNNAVEFLFHVGSLERDTKLHSYKEELSIERLPKDVLLTGNVRVSPGQGIAITTVDAAEAGILHHPVELDYLRGMTLSDETIDKLEERLPRSYPPISVKVEAYELGYTSLYFDEQKMEGVKRRVVSYLRGKIATEQLPNDLFYHVQNIHREELTAGESALRLLDRRNIFGNVLGHSRPYWLSENEENQLLDKLVRDESTHPQICRRLLAWTYRGGHKGIGRIVAKIVEGYKATTNQPSGINHRDGSVSLLANSLANPSLKKLELETVNTFINRLRSGYSNANDFRLMYNILQFDGDFFLKFSLDEQLMAEIFQRLYIRLVDSRKSRRPAIFQWILRCILYLLRYRETHPDFLRTAKMYAERFRRHDDMAYKMSELYQRIVSGLGISYPFESSKVKMLREVSRSFIEGSGRLEDIVVLGGDNEGEA